MIKINEEELYNLYFLANITQQKMKENQMGHVARMEQKLHAIFQSGYINEAPAGVPKRRWEDNIKIDIKETV